MSVRNLRIHRSFLTTMLFLMLLVVPVVAFTCHDDEKILTLEFSDVSPSAISCIPRSCSATEGSTISFSVTPPPMMTFREWVCSSPVGGLCSGLTDRFSSNTVFEVSSNLSSNATVTLTPLFDIEPKLTLEFSGISPSTISCIPRGCSATEGSTISFALNDPSLMMTFREWECDSPLSGLCSGLTNRFRSDTVFEVSNNLPSNAIVTLTPLFDTEMAKLILDVGEGGNVDGFLGMSSCSSKGRCRYDFPKGTEIQLRANPSRDYGFERWTRVNGSDFSVISNDGRAIRLNLDQDTTLEVTFERAMTTMVTLTINVGEGGYVDGFAGESQCNGPDTCTYTVAAGERVHIDAEANSGYRDGVWQTISGTSYIRRPGFDIDISPTSNTELEVTFRQIETQVCDEDNVVSVRWSPNPVGDSGGTVRVDLFLNTNCTSGEIAFEVYRADSRIAGFRATQVRGAGINGQFTVDGCPSGSDSDRSFYVRLSDGTEFKSQSHTLSQICEA